MQRRARGECGTSFSFASWKARSIVAPASRPPTGEPFSSQLPGNGGAHGARGDRHRSDSGIGKATAVALAKAGCDVGVTWHRDEEGTRETAAEIEQTGHRAEVWQLDLADLPAAADVVDELASALGGVNVFVNNAGTGGSKPFLELPYEDWRHTLAVDLDGAFLCGQRAARIMVAQGRGGRIVNVTSVHEHVPLRESAAYCAAKGGLGLLTKVMALELADHGITVTPSRPVR